MSEKTGLETQIWCSRERGVKSDFSRLEPIKYNFRKPRGGLWTSTYTPNEEYCSEWIDWCCSEAPEWATGECYLIEPEENVKIYEIDNAYDLEKLHQKYPIIGSIGSETIRDVDWVKACRDYDAIHLTSEGQWKTRFKTPGYGRKLNLYGWDSESTLWCRSKFKKITPIVDVKNRRCKITCD